MQTAVEYLQDHFKTLIQEDKKGIYKLLFEQAKELEKIQIIKANRDGVDMVVDKKPFIMGEDYYNKTYLNNNEIGIMTPENHIDVLSTVVKKLTSSQTEISDEEIVQKALEVGFTKTLFIDGAKWYREQLKSRQCTQ